MGVGSGVAVNEGVGGKEATGGGGVELGSRAAFTGGEERGTGLEAGEADTAGGREGRAGGAGAGAQLATVETTHRMAKVNRMTPRPMAALDLERIYAPASAKKLPKMRPARSLYSR